MRSKQAAALATVLLAVGCLVGIAIAWFASNTSFLGDFRAFYCAGDVARRGADPYLVEPLHACELATMEKPINSVWRAVVIPAPMPPYVIAAFSLVSLLPFKLAAFLWTSLMLLSGALSVAILSRITNVSLSTIVSAVLLSVIGTSLTLGQIAPLAIVATCVAALCVSRERWVWAAVAGASTLIEPAIGVPVCLSIAWWRPRTRIPLAACCAVLLLTSIVLGIQTNIEYVLRVLPAHAMSEIGSDEQYSLTVILHALGMAPRAAIFAGSAWYVGMLALGTAFAGVAAARLKQPAFYALLPPAICALGGPFMHLTQIAVAVPAALLLVSAQRRGLAFAALILVALPWPMAQSPAFAVIASLLTFAMAYGIFGGKVIPASIFAAIVAIVALALFQGYRTEAPSVSNRRVLSIDPQLAQASWGDLMTQRYSRGDAISWLKRAPTWAGLLLLVLAAGPQVNRRSRDLPNVTV